jgi:hypothetical protein
LLGKHFLLEYFIAAFKASLKKNLSGTNTLAYFGLATREKCFMTLTPGRFIDISGTAGGEGI